MPMPRKALVSVDTTPSYHVVSRCVRRTYLFGVVDNKDLKICWTPNRISPNLDINISATIVKACPRHGPSRK